MTATSSASVFRSIAQARRSTNRFQVGRTIPPETLRDILETTLRAPSSFNLQPSSIIIVKDPHVKESLAEKAMLGKGNQYRVKDCSVLAVFLSDLEADLRLNRVIEMERQHQQRHPSYLATLPLSASFLMGQGHAATFIKQISTNLLSDFRPTPEIEPIQAWSYKNTALAVQSFLLAATSHQLATSVMEGLDARRMREILRIPEDRYRIPMVVATGYDYDEATSDPPKRTARLPLEEMVFTDSFGIPWKAEPDTPDTE